MAEFFLKHNISSYAIELRGFGSTSGVRGHVDTLKYYYRDICTLNAIITIGNLGIKIFLAGESMGGLISYMLATTNPTLFDGLICLSPAFANNMKFSLSDYFKMFAPLMYDPKKSVKLPFTSEMITSDKDMQLKLDSDPNEIRFASSKLLFDIADTQFISRFNRRAPIEDTLFLLSGNDKIVDVKVSRKIFKRLKSPNSKLIEYPEMKHALSVEQDRKRVFTDILSWIRGLK